jgi:hypothetical protein
VRPRPTARAGACYGWALVVALLAFDRRECGENSTFSYVTTSGAHGGRTAAGEHRPRERVARLLRAVDEGAWLFLPFCVFSPDHARCADGARPRRRPSSEREGWLARARGGDCAGILVGREGEELVLRPAFNEWRGGDSLIAVAYDLGGLDAPLRRYVGSFARR